MDEKEIRRIMQEEIRQYMTNKQYTYSKIPSHSHTGIDSPLITAVNLTTETPIKLGSGGMVAYARGDIGSSAEQQTVGIVAGRDIFGETIGTTTKNLQLTLQHNTQGLDFMFAFKPPVYGSKTGNTISVTASGTIVTVSDYTFETNELAGAYINIYDSSGNFIETQTIASNTSKVITISSTWRATTNGGVYLIYKTVYLGAADYPWQRGYVMESIDGGLRFGVGPTAGGQNGLLYMSSGGDLFWRRKSAPSITGSTTQFDITNTAGDTYRYTYDGTGTDPGITGVTVPTGCQVSIYSTNFDSGNNGTFIVTFSDTNYFEVTNASGVAESNKTIGAGGYLKVLSTKLN